MINLYYVYNSKSRSWLTDDDDWSMSFNDAKEFQSADDAQVSLEFNAADENECFVFGWVQ